MGDEFGQVGPLEGVATGQYDEGAGRAECGQVIEQGLALRGTEFQRVAGADGIGPTVGTDQLAGPGHLPDNDEGPLGGVMVQQAHRAFARGFSHMVVLTQADAPGQLTGTAAPSVSSCSGVSAEPLLEAFSGLPNC